MAEFVLRLSEDVMGAGESVEGLGAVNRVVYVVAGDVVVGSGGTETEVRAGAAWFGTRAVGVTGGRSGGRVWRWEIGRELGRSGRVVLEHGMELDEGRLYLMRADRVEFELGGVALPHGHRGGGIRCLIAGALEVTVGEQGARTMRAGDAWFESGREPVLAKASSEVATSFIRVSVLPRELRGKSSIVYVDPADAGRAKPRTYTVYVDEPIDLA